MLDIHEFKTEDYDVYADNCISMYERWGFKAFAIEIKGAQIAIYNYIVAAFRKKGYICTFHKENPSGHDGDKRMRIMSTLQPLYANKSIYHFDGGDTLKLEEQIYMKNPKHDDIADSLHLAVKLNLKRKPAAARQGNRPSNVIKIDRQFGGRAFR